ncbi:hypothetical protein TGRUB_219840 [Toxoplasma gondii RUB]|uniref:Uncharacterized protein n=8 Tax=Toxoplasma gondii TaxID=5811 RepID=B9PQR9_TOXGV|nr:hypothetical protein TGGT1_219840 [Toxoplasma gondii GT1]ESS28787.1 hypothetical protein TGVEG_219840 [Toxoplasma gondii VEG]KFG38591.1 hypothetical protein TGP89_219840 [Toxoplasma gondii p89]KFG47808.1 hypothetical protein TGDOM2_219840 [Toxoplasma gondii GAB2-2007-GAL-DOM2]KFG51129.1 hypothetical protein TGFOU_219840 [Toxoplasma gondii FOU]KFG64949.1 hypothetical protein TGRUB_219840 [Toxoplasma gondii RUB]PUA88878.1 hypothetical protein TGBR9_219840 [Toxoplasma gondii TgCATBr9]RQX7162
MQRQELAGDEGRDRVGTEDGCGAAHPAETADDGGRGQEGDARACKQREAKEARVDAQRSEVALSLESVGRRRGERTTAESAQRGSPSSDKSRSREGESDEDAETGQYAGRDRSPLDGDGRQEREGKTNDTEDDDQLDEREDRGERNWGRKSEAFEPRERGESEKTVADEALQKERGTCDKEGARDKAEQRPTERRQKKRRENHRQASREGEEETERKGRAPCPSPLVSSRGASPMVLKTNAAPFPATTVASSPGDSFPCTRKVSVHPKRTREKRFRVSPFSFFVSLERHKAAQQR